MLENPFFIVTVSDVVGAAFIGIFVIFAAFVIAKSYIEDCVIKFKKWRKK